ncbi:MAG: nucleotide exchange factor GrpE [Halobacteriaceae archaeon]
MTEEEMSENVDEDSESDEPVRKLSERVADYDEGLGSEVAALEAELDETSARIEQLEQELSETEDELEERTEQLQRARADFQNYKKRSEKRLEEEKERATEELVTDLLDVRDNLERALDAEGDVQEGVKATLRSLDEVLESEDVELIEPIEGDEVDPVRHEVLSSVPSERPTGTIVDCHRPGFEMAGKVLREAQVTVSEEDESSNGS